MPVQRPSRRSFLRSAAAAAISAAPSAAFAGRRRILLVATNVDQVGGQTSGTFLMEIAIPFRRLAALGYELDVTTPRGGKAAVYHAGETWPELLAARDDPAFVRKTAETIPAEAIRAHDYAAVFYPGGHGQFWDVVEDQRIAAAAAQVHEAGGVIATVGHGAASLVNIRQSNGRYLVEGKRMTCFPWWAEREWMAISDYGKRLPFDMEAVLRERKADLVICTKETMRQQDLILVTDEPNRLITGSFATAAGPVAEGLHKLVSQGQGT